MTWFTAGVKKNDSKPTICFFKKLYFLVFQTVVVSTVSFSLVYEDIGEDDGDNYYF